MRTHTSHPSPLQAWGAAAQAGTPRTRPEFYVRRAQAKVGGRRKEWRFDSVSQDTAEEGPS